MKNGKRSTTIPDLMTFLTSNKILTVDELITFIDQYKWPTVSRKKIKYYNVPVAFDIETSSFRINGEKCAIMYEWTFSFFGAVVIGRTWDEFINMLDRICDKLNTSPDQRIVCYIHNLSFEFAFMRKFFEWRDVFAIDTYKPIRACTDRGVEFRCSYVLSGYSLATVAKNLTEIKISKLKGELNYDLIRTPLTPLTDREIQYCVNDVQIVVAYIQERIIFDGNIAKIPHTKTGYVRQYCRKMCFYG